MMKAIAKSHSNIALVKYWGKRNEKLNLPAVGSISITLKEIFTLTSVEFQKELKEDILKTKIIEVKFKENVKDYGKVPEGIKIIDKTELDIKLEVDRAKHEIERVINYIIKHYPIKDINVSNPEIEEVIKKIYEK